MINPGSLIIGMRVVWSFDNTVWECVRGPLGDTARAMWEIRCVDDGGQPYASIGMQTTFDMRQSSWEYEDEFEAFVYDTRAAARAGGVCLGIHLISR